MNIYVFETRKAWNRWFWTKKKIWLQWKNIGKKFKTNTLAKSSQNICAYSFVSEHLRQSSFRKKLFRGAERGFYKYTKKRGFLNIFLRSKKLLKCLPWNWVLLIKMCPFFDISLCVDFLLWEVKGMSKNAELKFVIKDKFFPKRYKHYLNTFKYNGFNFK